MLKFGKLTIGTLLLLMVLSLQAQNKDVKIGIVGNKISDFVLPTYQGGEFDMQKMRGKNVLLIVSRGKYSADNWCTICCYQYAEYADLELTQELRKKYNMEIAFLFPFNKDTMIRWEKDYPNELAKIKKWKNPDKIDSLTTKQRSWMEFARANYPKTFDFTNIKIPKPLPILLDGKFEVAKGLDLYRNEWNKGKADQNIPTIFIIDKDGIIRFKYMAQSAPDRPTLKYILKFIEKMM
jgi:peroxiredoxin